VNIKTYKALCSTCNDIIRKNINLYKLSIPYLNIIRPHPSFLEKYNINDSKTNNGPGFWIRLVNLFRPDPNRSFITGLDYDVVIVSHLINEKDFINNVDLYFPDFAQCFKEQNAKCLFLMINHTKTSAQILQEKTTNQVNVFKYILPGKVIFTREIWHIINLLRQIIILRFQAIFESGLNKHVLLGASSLSGLVGALANLRIASQVQDFVREYRPRVILTTFEGHPWEKIVYSKIYDVDRSVTRVGYQHSVVNKDSNSLFQSFGLNSDPDIILTSGLVTQDLFAKYHENRNVDIHMVGSHKSNKAEGFSKKSNKTCLVIPEGILSECELLFKFSMSCALKFPDVRFIWRLHSLISFKQVLHVLKTSIDSIPSNIELSNKSLSSDIQSSSFAIYRGSTAIVDAVKQGVVPLYLDREKEISINFFGQHIYKDFVIKTELDFIKFIRYGKVLNLEKFITFSEKYFTPFNCSSLGVLLNEKK